MRQTAKWLSVVLVALVMVGGGMISQAAAAPCVLSVVTEGLACDANAGQLFYSGVGEVTITAQPNAADFNSFLVLYKPGATAIGQELGGDPLLFNHGAPSGPINLDPEALGFGAGEELIFALFVDTNNSGTIGNFKTESEYRVFMGPATRNTPNGVQDHLEPVPAPPGETKALVGFEDKLTDNPTRDSDFNDHIFLFEGAILITRTPNPGAVWLLGLGLIGVGIAGRRWTRR